MEVLTELTRWGEAGYSSLLTYGETWQNEEYVVGWMCVISYMSKGSVFIDHGIPAPFGYHPTDPLIAARVALRQAAERWPSVAETL